MPDAFLFAKIDNDKNVTFIDQRTYEKTKRIHDTLRTLGVSIGECHDTADGRFYEIEERQLDKLIDRIEQLLARLV